MSPVTPLSMRKGLLVDNQEDIGASDDRALVASWAERFWAKVSLGGPSECWPWTAGKCGSGYGSFHLDGRQHLAHRVAIRLAGLGVEQDEVVDHVCRNRACVNPAHLRAVDRVTNVHENSQAPAHLNSLKTHCAHGHPYSGRNLVLRKGARGCRVCMTEYQRRKRAKK